MNARNIPGLLLITMIMAACQEGEKMVATIHVDSKYETGTDGWSAGFSDYATTVDTATLHMRSYRAKMPVPLDTNTYGLRMQSHNRSNDMFMYIKKKISGLRPKTSYTVTFDIDFGTKYPEGGIGAGGSPGSSVYLKAGATAEEPRDTIVDHYHKFTLDKGSQSEGGKDLILLGNVANGTKDTLYHVVKRGNVGSPITAIATDKGELWLCVGTDSGFEGLSVFYYDRINVKISEKID